MRGNTITIKLTPGKLNGTGGLTQYDYGQRLIIELPEGEELPEYYQVHFSNDPLGSSITVMGDSTGVDIPDNLLQSGEDIYFWLYISEEESAETERRGVFRVTRRASITDIQPTPTQASTIDGIITALNGALDTVEDLAESIPQDIEDALDEAKESGEFDGPKGDKGDQGDKGDKGDPGDPTELIDDTAGAGDTDKAWSADRITELLQGKAPKANPVFTGTVSFGRASESTVGYESVALGGNVEASGGASFAEGKDTVASGHRAHAEGQETIASGGAAHSEGNGTVASGGSAHSEGTGSEASGVFSHAEGWYTKATHKSQHAGGQFNVPDPSENDSDHEGEWLEVIGNGANLNTRSNARTLDWDGNERLAGDLYVGCDDDSTGGEKVAKESDLEKIPGLVEVTGTSGNPPTISAKAAWTYTFRAGAIIPLLVKEAISVTGASNMKLSINSETAKTLLVYGYSTGDTIDPGVYFINSFNGSYILYEDSIAGSVNGYRVSAAAALGVNTSWPSTPSDSYVPTTKLVNTKLNTKYTKPSSGIPASDLADGVIPDLTDLIDDTAGSGDTDKTWSADKIDDELSDVNFAITSQFGGNAMLFAEWLQGNYTNASEDPPTSYNSNSTRIRSKITVNVKSKLNLSCFSGYKYTYSLYVDNVRKEYESANWLTANKSFEYGSGEYVLYISIARTGSGDLSPEQADGCVAVLADNAVSSLYDAITQNTTDLSAMNTASSSDEGKALKAKTVSSGKVTEWEFGEAGGGTEIDDTKGAGVTDKTWSANKLTDEFGKDREILAKLELLAEKNWEWVQGNYSDISQDPPTSTSTVATRIRSTFTVDASKKVSMITQNGYKCIYSIYKDGTRLEYQSSAFIEVNKIWDGAGEYTIYVALANSSNTNIAPSEADNALVVLVDNEVLNIYDAIAGNTDAIKEIDKKYSDALAEAFPGNPMFTLQWLLGGYSNLADNPPVNYNAGNTRARLKVSVDVKSKLTVSCASGYKYVYSVYKGDTRQAYNASNWSTDASKDFEYGEGTYTLYMNCATSSNADMTVDEAKSAITILADNAVLNVYDAIGAVDALKETKNLYDPGANNTLRGYYNASNTWVTSYDFGQTDYIPVKQGAQYISSLLSTAVLWFDENKDFLQSTASSDYKGWITPPTGAAYAKFMIRISDQVSFYIHSNESDSVQVPLNVIPYGLYNQYARKKAVAFGTSLTYRAKSSGGYLEYLPEMAQMTVDNQGLGNSTILEHQDHTDMMGMITGYTGYADKDVVLLEGFVNDWYDNSDKLGTWKDEGVITSTTVCGRIRYAINYILTQNPHTTLIIILDPYGQAYNGNAGCASTVVKSGYTQMEYYDEIAKLAASLGIPTIKGYAISGMNELVSDYYIDIIHPSPLGAKQFADVVWSEMQNIPIKTK